MGLTTTSVTATTTATTTTTTTKMTLATLLLNINRWMEKKTFVQSLIRQQVLHNTD